MEIREQRKSLHTYKMEGCYKKEGTVRFRVAKDRTIRGKSKEAYKKSNADELFGCINGYL